MTKRLQVLFDDSDYAALQTTAASQGMTVAEWVRQVLTAARRATSTLDTDRKLAAIRHALRHTAPTGPIDRLIGETERSYATPDSGGY